MGTLEKKVFDAAKRELLSRDGCHDFDHTLRVAANAEALLAQSPEADGAVVKLAVWLHDCARNEEDAANGAVDHARRGAEKARSLLLECGASSELAERVSRAVARHRFRGGNAPQTIEEKIVYDADKLDSLGAVGIGRAFHFAGRIGARLHNAKEEALSGAPYGKEDTAYREYLVKLQRLPEKMQTLPGKRLAEVRVAFMKAFFDRLAEETSVK
ncbi:MAG: HD domain-containing protein [Victivallaceae bacterium]|nr:HD domain-containing protein [Victivallaceae bacterium]